MPQCRNYYGVSLHACLEFPSISFFIFFAPAKIKNGQFKHMSNFKSSKEGDRMGGGHQYKKINKRRITARKVYKTQSPQQICLAP